jgi:hypothetical protein
MVISTNKDDINEEKKEGQSISLDELVKQSSDKIITDYEKVRECSITAANKTVDFEYKSLRKGIYLKAQATGDEEKLLDMILTNTLWNSAKGRFFTLKELNLGIPPIWQGILLAKIVDESGFNISDLDVNF